MSVWGKIIGGVGGFAIGGPIGALIGAVAGHAVDKARGQGEEPEDATKSVAFSIATIALGAKMAKADGRVTRDEVDAFKQVFRVPPEEVAQVSKFFDQARKDSRGFEPYARQVTGMFADNPAVLGAFHLSVITGRWCRSSGRSHYLRSVSNIFGLDNLRSRASPPWRRGHIRSYKILGVERTISDDDLKTAYRALVRENHPDKLIAEGLPEELVELANEAPYKRCTTNFRRSWAELGHLLDVMSVSGLDIIDYPSPTSTNDRTVSPSTCWFFTIRACRRAKRRWRGLPISNTKSVHIT